MPNTANGVPPHSNADYDQVKCGEIDETIRGDNCKRQNSFLRQVLPVLCGCTINISFGLMLGWPSPTFPQLLAEDSPVPITIDQSAIIAGFLMWGNAAGALPSFTKRAGAKYGMIIGKVLILIGWAVMWRVESVYGLFASRFLVGFGHAFGAGQLRSYVTESCSPSLARSFHKHLNVFTNVGVVLVYVIGAATDFRTLCLICFVASAATFCAICCVPQTAIELVRRRKFEEAKQLLEDQGHDLDSIEYLIDEYERAIMDERTVKQMNISHILKNKTTRTSLIIFVALIASVQYSGGPPSIVYTQLIFGESGIPHPEYLAIAYALTFLIASLLGTDVYKTYNKKLTLTISYLCVSLALLCQILALMYALDKLWWTYISMAVMLIFNVVHTMGLTTVFPDYMAECFPATAKVAVTKVFVIHYSVAALTSTKLFQVLYARYGMPVAFSTCSFVACMGFLVTLCLVVVSACMDGEPDFEVTEEAEDKSVNVDMS